MNITTQRISEVKENMSQEEFAKSVNTTQSTISKVLNGDSPSLNLLMDIAKTYHVSIDWLLGISTRKSLYGYSVYDSARTITYSDIISLLVALIKNNSLKYDFPSDDNEDNNFNGYYSRSKSSGKLIISDRYIDELASVASTLISSSPEAVDSWLKKISEDYETELLKWDSTEDAIYCGQRKYYSSLEILRNRKSELEETN